MLVVPILLVDVISVAPAIRPNWRSSGVATEEAMISGLAPGTAAATEIVGKSTCGRAATGNSLNATAPARAKATVRSVVATGRSMNGEDRLMANPPARTPGLLVRNLRSARPNCVLAGGQRGARSRARG